MATTTSKKSSGSKSGSKAASKKQAAGTKSSSGSKDGAKSTKSTAASARKTGGSKNSSASKSGTSKTKNSTTGSTSKKAASKSDNTKSTSTAKSGSTAKEAKKGSSRSASSGSAKSNTSTAKGNSSSKKRSSKKSDQGKSTSSSGIVGRVASAVGGLFGRGESDVLELLKEDHRVVDGYFQEVKADEDANHEKTFKKIKSELDVHAHVEEVIVYPHFLEVGSEELQKIVREGVEEHAQMKTLLLELSELKGSDDVFKAKLKVLIENVEHHVEEEENETFSLAEDELDRETLRTLAERVETEKANFQKASGSRSARRSGK